MEILEIGQKVCRIRKGNKTTIRKFKSGLIVNTIKGIILHPITGRPTYVFEEDDSFLECKQCKKVNFDDNGNIIPSIRGSAFTPRTTGSPIKVYPIANGNHNNIYFIAKDRKNIFKFKIRCFFDTLEVQIAEFNSNIDIDLLDFNVLYDFINKGLMKWDFKLSFSKNKFKEITKLNLQK